MWNVPYYAKIFEQEGKSGGACPRTQYYAAKWIGSEEDDRENSRKEVTWDLGQKYKIDSVVEGNDWKVRSL